jgi:hypothetical protein
LICKEGTEIDFKSFTHVEEMSKPIVPGAQVAALPIGSGGSNATKKQLNDINVSLSMMTAQAMADQKYDPPPPIPVRAAMIKEAFCSMDPSQQVPFALAAIGAGLVIYGLI